MSTSPDVVWHREGRPAAHSPVFLRRHAGPARFVVVAALPCPAWQDDDSLVRFLRSFERLLPLKEPSRLSERSTARTILDRSGGITGEIAEMLTLAASRAIRRGEERITAEILDQVYPVRRLQ